MKFLRITRLPLTVLGLVLLFVTERYFDTSSNYKLLVGIVFGLQVAGAIASLMVKSGVKKTQHEAEAKSWGYAALWQFGVLVGCGLYLLSTYKLSVAGVDTFGAKAGLAGWLLVSILSVFAGI